MESTKVLANLVIRAPAPSCWGRAGVGGRAGRRDLGISVGITVTLWDYGDTLLNPWDYGDTLLDYGGITDYGDTLLNP